MSNRYDSLKGQQILNEFETAAMERMGMAEIYPAAAGTMDKIAQLIHDDVRYVTGYDETRAYIWEQGDMPIRAVMAVGSIATSSWRFPHNRRGSRVELYTPFMFDTNRNVADFAVTTDDSRLVVSALRAVCDEYVNISPERTRGLPSGIMAAATKISKIANADQLDTIRAGMTRILFSEQHTDSSESDDPHPSEKALFDEAIPQSFRHFLLNSALNDTRRATYKPHVWRSQMDVTLRNLANDPKNALRFLARREMNLPEDDKSYNALREQGRQEAAAEKTRRATEREQAVTTQQDLVQAKIATVLSN